MKAGEEAAPDAVCTNVADGFNPMRIIISLFDSRELPFYTLITIVVNQLRDTAPPKW